MIFKCTNAEYKPPVCPDILLLSQGSAALFRTFPNRRQRNHKTFRWLQNTLGKSGLFHAENKNSERPREIDTDMEDENVVLIVEDEENQHKTCFCDNGNKQICDVQNNTGEKAASISIPPVQHRLAQEYPSSL